MSKIHFENNREHWLTQIAETRNRFGIPRTVIGSNFHFYGDINCLHGTVMGINYRVNDSLPILEVSNQTIGEEKIAYLIPSSEDSGIWKVVTEIPFLLHGRGIPGLLIFGNEA